MNLHEQLTQALAAHRSGNTTLAVQLYEQILAVAPKVADAWHLRGALALSSGDLTTADRCLREAVRLRPTHASFYNSLGSLCKQQEAYDQAISAFDRAILLQPNYAEAYFNRGNVLRRQDKPSEAIESYEQAISLKPDFADAYLSRGAVLLDLGRAEEALSNCNQAIEINPEFAEAYSTKGNALHKLCRLEEALESLDCAIRLKPQFAAAYSIRGTVLLDLGRVEEALASYSRAIEIDPDFAEAYSNKGNVLRESNQLEEALESFDCAIRLKPTFTEAYSNRGAVLLDLGRAEEALTSSSQAIEINPDFAQAYSNKGNALRELNRLEEALASLDCAIRLKPNFAVAYSSRGAVLLDLGRAEESLASCRQAIEISPDSPNAHWNLCFASLVLGDFPNGWRSHEYRWQVRELNVTRPSFPQPLWQGEALAGKTILLVSEQGLGDTLQFIRYAAELENLGATVFFECQPALKNILRRCRGIKAVVPRGGLLPAFDFFLPLLSTPLRLGTTLQSVPWSGPYLFADNSLTATWRERLGKFPGRKIGLAWQGSRTYTGDRLRSPPLAAFLPLADTPQTTFISLQKGPGTDQLANVADRLPIVEFPTLDDRGAFEDTAAILRNLDLFITSDSAVAHLAGGMGVPTWLVLPYAPDWRWLLEREDSPWYPSVRLFRQQERGDWTGVFARLPAELRG